jgi:DNA-binding response OmpR family regulator
MKSPSFPPHFAVIEDDPRLCSDLVEYLQLRGLTATGFESAEAFFEIWPTESFDLLLLDIALPGASGLEVARRVREQDSTGIVMLTALDAAGDQVTGLTMGADAYLSKQSPLELIEATCQSVLRRMAMGNDHKDKPSRMERWHLSHKKWSLTAPNGVNVILTHSEVTFLTALFNNPGEAVKRNELLALLGRQETFHNLRNLDNAASRLRRKVESACGIKLPVRSSYGSGYTFSGECEVAP